MKIETALKKYPNGMIYYHDNGAWIYYKTCPTNEQLDTSEIPENLIVAEGDSMEDYGYAPSMVRVLAKQLGIKVYSI